MDVDVFEMNQVNIGVEVRQYGQQYCDIGQFVEQVRGFIIGGVYQGNQYYQCGYFYCGQQQVFFWNIVVINFVIYFWEVIVVGGMYIGLVNQYYL